MYAHDNKAIGERFLQNFGLANVFNCSQLKWPQFMKNSWIWLAVVVASVIIVVLVGVVVPLCEKGIICKVSSNDDNDSLVQIGARLAQEVHLFILIMIRNSFTSSATSNQPASASSTPSSTPYQYTSTNTFVSPASLTTITVSPTQSTSKATSQDSTITSHATSATTTTSSSKDCQYNCAGTSCFWGCPGAYCTNYSGCADPYNCATAQSTCCSSSVCPT